MKSCCEVQRQFPHRLTDRHHRSEFSEKKICTLLPVLSAHNICCKWGWESENETKQKMAFANAVFRSPPNSTRLPLQAYEPQRWSKVRCVLINYLSMHVLWPPKSPWYPVFVSKYLFFLGGILTFSQVP